MSVWRGYIVTFVFLGLTSLLSGAEQGDQRTSSSDLRLSPKFSDFPAAAAYRGVVALPHFRKSSHPESLGFPDGDGHCGWMDDLSISNIYGNMKPNFAAKYVITGCTCGSGCHYLLMWNAETGAVIRNLPFGSIDVGPLSFSGATKLYAGEEHHVGSNLLVVEGCLDYDAHPRRHDCGRHSYVWQRGRFVQAARRVDAGRLR